jgi:hypothetical protein
MVPGHGGGRWVAVPGWSLPTVHPMVSNFVQMSGFTELLNQRAISMHSVLEGPEGQALLLWQWEQQLGGGI